MSSARDDRTGGVRLRTVYVESPPVDNSMDEPTGHCIATLRAAASTTSDRGNDAGEL
jgi:hypothetical protein